MVLKITCQKYGKQFVGSTAKALHSRGWHLDSNSFSHSITKMNNNAGAIQVTSTKQVGDGWIKQIKWDWGNGTTTALTTKPNGFISLVSKEKGKVVHSMISNSPTHLVEKGFKTKTINGKTIKVPYANYVEGRNTARISNGKLKLTSNSNFVADHMVKEARSNAEKQFYSI